MENAWFECKVRYEKLDGNGAQTKVAETYLVDALSFTDAEARIIKEMKPQISITEDFVVANIKRVKFADMVMDPSGDFWYKARVLMEFFDEEKGAEKKSSLIYYVQATDFARALENLQDELEKCVGNYKIMNMAETPIMDVYRYEQPVPEGFVPVEKEEKALQPAPPMPTTSAE